MIVGTARTAPARAADLRNSRRVALVFHMLVFSWTVALMLGTARGGRTIATVPSGSY